MLSKFLSYCLQILILSLFVNKQVFAISNAGQIDEIRMLNSKSQLDVRTHYKEELLNAIMAASEHKYGAYKINKIATSMTSEVAFVELYFGKTINITMGFAMPDSDHLAIPIRIPIRRGIHNYRLLAINKDKQNLFDNINSLLQLKALTVGIHESSTTEQIMQILGFNVVEGASYDGMFRQLAENQFDYIPRGIHEAFDELALRKESLPNLIIEPNLALFMPMPFYIYVSPQNPKLAERIEYGLSLLIEKGEVKKLFDRYHSKDIERANLAGRTIINIGNPFLSKKTPWQRKELWIDFGIKNPE